MPRGPAKFSQSDITRAIKGVKDAGVEIARVRIAKDGTIEIDPGKPPAIDGDPADNPWDTL